MFLESICQTFRILYILPICLLILWRKKQYWFRNKLFSASYWELQVTSLPFFFDEHLSISKEVNFYPSLEGERKINRAYFHPQETYILMKGYRQISTQVCSILCCICWRYSRRGGIPHPHQGQVGRDRKHFQKVVPETSLNIKYICLWLCVQDYLLKCDKS